MHNHGGNLVVKSLISCKNSFPKMVSTTVSDIYCGCEFGDLQLSVSKIILQLLREEPTTNMSFPYRLSIANQDYCTDLHNQFDYQFVSVQDGSWCVQLVVGVYSWQLHGLCQLHDEGTRQALQQLHVQLSQQVLSDATATVSRQTWNVRYSNACINCALCPLLYICYYTLSCCHQLLFG